MLHALAQWLSQDVRVFSVFSYITLRAVLPNRSEPPLLPGMFVHVHLTVGQRPGVIVIPQRAVVKLPSGQALHDNTVVMTADIREDNVVKLASSTATEHVEHLGPRPGPVAEQVHQVRGLVPPLVAEDPEERHGLTACGPPASSPSRGPAWPRSSSGSMAPPMPSWPRAPLPRTSQASRPRPWSR